MGSASSNKNFPVTIICGGIGGLTLAVVIEAASVFTEIGIVLSIGLAAHRAMPLIDPKIREIYDSLVTTHADSPGCESYAQTWFEVVWASGVHEGNLLMDLEALLSEQTTPRRANFRGALVNLIPPEIFKFGKRLAKLDETANGVNLYFDDGTIAIADVVVGCDGIKSKVKESMLPEESKDKQPQYNGIYRYRAGFGMDKMVKVVGGQRARESTMYIGEGAYGISYPIMRAQEVNVGLYILNDTWDCNTQVLPAKTEDMLRDASTMGKYWKSLVEHMPDPSQWAVFEHPALSTYTRSRVAILGDAAHASTPHQGAGAVQAIEDALVLAELLGDFRVRTVSDVKVVFKAYDEVRLPRN